MISRQRSTAELPEKKAESVRAVQSRHGTYNVKGENRWGMLKWEKFGTGLHPLLYMKISCAKKERISWKL